MSKKTLAAKPSLVDMQAHACEASSLMKAMSNEQRLLILCLLFDGELSVGELQPKIELSQSALSQHLAVLREAGFVETRREAQTVLYSLPNGPVKKVMQTLHKIYCE